MSTAAIFHIGDSYHLQLAAMTVASAKRAGMKTVMLTDMSTPAIEGVDQVCRYPHLPPELMVANIDAQKSYLLSAPTDEHIWFLDTDILIRRDPTEHMPAVWLNYVDMAVTVRRGNHLFEEMPYNYGVIYARPTLRAISLWVQLQDEVRALPLERRLWYGNQIALRKVLGEPGEALDVLTPGTSRAGLLPLVEFNHAPTDVDDICERSHVLHYKGQRKQFMADHYRILMEEAHAPS